MYREIIHKKYVFNAYLKERRIKNIIFLSCLESKLKILNLKYVALWDMIPFLNLIKYEF